MQAKRPRKDRPHMSGRPAALWKPNLFFHPALTWIYYQIIAKRRLASLHIYGPRGRLVCGAAFLLYRMFTRIECTKSSTVLFTRSAGDNKSVSVCMPATLGACAHMPACAHVWARPSPCKCACETAVYFTRRCSWCLASGPCHDPWHCQWLTSSAYCATASTLLPHSPPPLRPGLVFFSACFCPCLCIPTLT